MVVELPLILVLDSLIDVMSCGVLLDCLLSINEKHDLLLLLKTSDEDVDFNVFVYPVGGAFKDFLLLSKSQRCSISDTLATSGRLSLFLNTEEVLFVANKDVFPVLDDGTGGVGMVLYPSLLIRSLSTE